MINAPVTPLYAGLLGLTLLVLSVLVIRQRVRVKLALGLGEDLMLLRASRAQGNFVEYAPLLLVMLLALELGGTPFWLLHGIGLAVVGGRLSHALAISREPEQLQLRQLGMLLTFTALLVASLALLWMGLAPGAAGE